MVTTLIATAALTVWLYLIAGRGGFWLANQRDPGGPAPQVWPAVTAVIPARDEADSVGACIGSLLRQDYAGPFAVILVDDGSGDGTAAVARTAASAAGLADRLTVLPGRTLPAGWTGKLWAMKQGVELAEAASPAYLLLTDADIVYAPDALSRLVARAAADGLVLNSLMVQAPLRQPCRAGPHPGFCLLLSDALPLRLGEPPRSGDGGRRRRVHAGPR